MSGKKGKPKYKAFFISLILSAVILGSGLFLMEGINIERITARLFFPLLRLMFFITLGLTAGQVIEASGWTRSISVVARPFFRFGNLGEHCSAAFTIAFVSGVTANAMLLDFYKEKKITEKQLFLTNFVNQFPAYFLHLPTTLFIVLPLTGTAGLLYYILTFLATVLRTFLFLVYGRFSVKTAETVAEAEKEDQKRKKGDILKSIREKLPARIINISVYVLPIYIAVFVVNELGFFKLANDFISRKVALSIIPIESLSVVILSFAAEFTSGFAAAGAMLDAGLITVKQTVLALLIGNILAFPIRALRHQLPRYMGIFSPKMGAQILLLGQLFRVLSLIIVGIIFFVIA
ncbi:nucleoside recognition protein [Desulfobacterales bacterium HSG2]|nr:nucleoside recognition protein [Desulfobacterales bacterium HSG2]